MLVSNRILPDRITRGLALILALLLCLAMAAPALAYTIPAPNADFYVNDTADLISQDNEDYIIETNRSLCKETGAQVLIVTIKSLEGAGIEEYATDLFRQYGIGDASKNNGILLLLSLEDRECRIEVGYGLEGAITDGKAGRIMDKCMIPFFKEGQWDEGMVNGFDAILDEICKEYDIELTHNPVRSPSREAITEEDDNSLMETIYLGIFCVVGLIAGLFMGKVFPGKAFIPGLIFLMIYYATAIAMLSVSYVIGVIVLGTFAYLIGWGITSPDIDDGGYSGGSYGGYSSSNHSSSSYSSGSSSRSYGGGGRSGGGGASRKF